MSVYYSDDRVTLHHGDALEITEWLAADVLVTDPPYGISWVQPEFFVKMRGKSFPSKGYDGIANDGDTACRDAVLAAMGGKPQVVFGSPLLPPPEKTKQVLIWKKPLNSGVFGAIGGFRRDIEAVYLLGPWPKRSPDRSAVIASSGSVNQAGLVGGHPHSKPVQLLEAIIDRCPPGTIADPFAGSGSTLIAARNLGRKAIGVELEEKYCEIIARRLDQQAFDFEEEPA